jgi:hypothetical protein
MNNQNFTGFSAIPYSSIGLFLNSKPGDKIVLSGFLWARHVEFNPNDVSLLPAQFDFIGAVLCGVVLRSLE